MNMQAMMKQAQKLQNDVMKAQEEINKMEFVGQSSLVSVKINGKGEVIETKIDAKTIADDEIELLQDMIVVAFSDAKKQLDKTT